MQNEKKIIKIYLSLKRSKKFQQQKKLLSNPLVRKMTYQMAFVCIQLFEYLLRLSHKTAFYTYCSRALLFSHVQKNAKERNRKKKKNSKSTMLSAVHNCTSKCMCFTPTNLFKISTLFIYIYILFSVYHLFLYFKYSTSLNFWSDQMFFFYSSLAMIFLFLFYLNLNTLSY